MRSPFFRTFRSILACAVFCGALLPLFAIHADPGVNRALEPAESDDGSGDVVTTAADPIPAAHADALYYAGEIRRYPAEGNATPVKGYLSVAISPLGKVSGIVTWYDTHEQVKVKGKQDLATHHGSFAIRDAAGNPVPGATRLPFRISGKGQLVGGGVTEAGETTSFRVPKVTPVSTSYGYGGYGGATIDLGGGSFSSGVTTLNTGSLNFSPGSVQTGTLNLGGAAINPTTVSGGGILTSNGSLATTVGTATTSPLISLPYSTVTTLNVSRTGGSAPTLDGNGNLALANTMLLLGPVTSTTAADGTITYTGKNTYGGIGMVIVHFV